MTGITLGPRDRQAGVQSLTADQTAGQTQPEVLYKLLERISTQSGTAQVRFQFAGETFTAQQLMRALETNDQRAMDLLRANGISMPEMVELCDDALRNPNLAGATIDCRPGSATARTYGIGAAGDDTVDIDTNPTRLRAAAEASAPMSRAFDTTTEQVSGPGFFTMIGEAIVEALAAIGRAFGASWNPDTETFNGRVDDNHFRTLGADMARSPHGPVFALALRSPEGRDTLRAEMLAKRPQNASEAQWRRAVEDMMTGMTSAGSAPAGLSEADSRSALTYLRANGYSETANANLALVMAQPPEVRSRLLEAITSLPEPQRNNVIELLRAPGDSEGLEGAAFNTWCVRTDYERATPEQRLAIVETLRRDGFRSEMSGPEVQQVTSAAVHANTLPEEARGRYLALLPRMGASRAYLFAADRGLARRLEGLPVADQLRLLGDVERNLGSTSTLIRLIAHSNQGLRLALPSAGTITSAATKAQVVDTFARNNITITVGDVRITGRGLGDSLSLESYFNDPAYRETTLASVGLTREAFEGFLQNANESFRNGDGVSQASRVQPAQDIAFARDQINDPRTSEMDRRAAWQELRTAQLENETGFSATNVTVDLSPGSQADRLFGLRSTDRSSALYGFGAALLTTPYAPDFTLVARGRNNADIRITRSEMASVLTDPLPEGKTRAQMFADRFFGLDFNDTLIAFAHVVRMHGHGDLRREHSRRGFEIDLRQRTGYAALDGLRSKLTDGRDGNVARPTFLEAALPLRTIEEAAPLRFSSDAEVGAVAGNNWFQYGVFRMAAGRIGYYSSMEVRDAADRNRTLQGFGEALFQLDDFRNQTRLGNGTRSLEIGETTGTVSRLFGDGITPSQVRVMSFVGRGPPIEQRAFAASGRNIGDAATSGGIPASNISRRTTVATPREMYDEVRAQLLSEPRPRTLVVHYAGHTGSGPANVDGFVLTGADGQRAFFTPADMRALNELAVQEGVNLTWVTDACRGGEYVEQARGQTIQRLADEGRLPPSVASLEKLRHGTVDLYRSFQYLIERPRAPAPYPSDAALSTLVRRALHDGPSSDAMRELRALRDGMANNQAIHWADREVLNMFVRSTEEIHTARAALRNEPGLPAEMLNHAFLTGDLPWRAGRPFAMYTMGPLYDNLSAELRERMPPIRTPEAA